MQVTILNIFSDGATKYQAGDFQFTVAASGRVQWSDGWITVNNLAIAGTDGFSQVHSNPYNHTDIYYQGVK